MVDAVAIAGHVRTLAHGDAAAKARAAWALWRLMCPPPGEDPSEEPGRAITAAGATFLLVELLQSGGHGARCAAGALANLAYNDDNRGAIAAAGAIAPLVELMRNDRPDAKYGGAHALGNLAFKHHDNKVAIAAAGAIAPLVEVVRSGCADAQASAAFALANLAYNDDNKVAIAAAGAIVPLVALMRSGSATIPRWAASGTGPRFAKKALKNLAHDNVDNQVLIAEAKGDIKELVALARSASSDAARIAAKFLARRRLAFVRKCVDGKVPAELESTIAASLALPGIS